MQRVAEEDKQTCYQLVTSRILRVIGVDWERTAEICASVEKNWVASCFESYGRDVAGQSHRDPEEILDSARLRRPYGGERECIRFAAMDMVANYTSGFEAAAVSATERPATLRPDLLPGDRLDHGPLSDARARERAADCRSIDELRADVAACIRGVACPAGTRPLGR